MIKPGHILRNRYEILELIGRGGMADVYLAFDRRRMARVAIKILREDLAEDPDFVRRFAREAQALARLDHPNIVRFFSFEREGLTAFIVLEYVEGVTLRRRLAEQAGPLPLDETTAILRQIASALHYAHNEGFIHRDLKPGNVMIDKHGRALLTDFGIAKALESATVTTMAVGTPAYMSPEQILGRPLDHRTDIYSLGVMLFQMVTGRRPFTGEEPGLTGTGTLARLRDAHLHATPPRPSQLNPALPPEVDEVILRALAKRPEDRWQDVVSLLRAWEAALGEEPTVVMERPRPQPVATPRMEGREKSAEVISDQYSVISGANDVAADRERSPAPRGRGFLWPAIAGVLAVLALVLAGMLVGGSMFGRERPGEPVAIISQTPKTNFSADLLPSVSTSSLSILTLTPTFTRAPTLTQKPTLTPTPTSTPTPRSSFTPITPDNSQSITQKYTLNHPNGVRKVQFSTDGAFLASELNNDIVTLWHFSNDNIDVIQTIQGRSDGAHGVAFAFSPNTKVFACGQPDNTIGLWRLMDGELLYSFRGHNWIVNDIDFNSDGSLLASASWDKTVRLWNVASETLFRTFQGFEDGVLSVSFSPDDTSVASGDNIGTIDLRRVSDGSKLCKRKEHLDWIGKVQFSPNGNFLASSSRDGNVILWDVANCTMYPLQEEMYSSQLPYIEFSPDGKLIAAPTNNNDIGIWQATNFSLIHILKGHKNVVTSVAFSPDGRLLASGSYDNTVKIWRVSDGELLRTLERHTSIVNYVVFSPNGTLLASGSKDGTIRLWGVADLAAP